MKLTAFQYEQGIGVCGGAKGNWVHAVGPNYFTSHNKALPHIPSEINQNNETVNFLLVDEKLIGITTLSGAIRKSSAEAIADLKSKKK